MQTDESQKVTKSTPQDVFLHLLATITLYTSVFALVSLLFDYVNLELPDALNPGYGIGSSIRWEMALLIIMFSMFVWTFRFLRRDICRAPEKVDLRIRRWLMYLTLFLAALLILGDLVALLYSFLEGELTVRFGLKVLILLVVAGVTFGFYLYDIRRRAETYAPRARMLVWVAIACVAIAAVSGFFLIGSPFKQRLMRFDVTRIRDLQGIQSQIVGYWQGKESLPKTLDELRDSISGYVPPVDPQTKTPYEYRATGNLAFELCAVFNFSSAEERGIVETGYYEAYPLTSKGETWDHAAGRACFERTIDPDLYRKHVAPVPPKL